MRSGLLGLMVLWAAAALAQGSGTTPSHSELVRPIGVVTQLQSGKFVLHTDAGADLLILLSEQVSVLRVPPGAKDLSAASKITVSDISAGDRVLVRGRVSDDQKSMLAVSVIVMTKADVANAQESERLDWQRRGIAGTVTAVNPERQKITIAVPGGPSPAANGARSQTISLAANAIPQRHAPDSVKFSDAKPSTLEEIKVGDQIRALGTKAEDGSFLAEKLVSGTFRNFGVTVVSVDAQNRTIAAKDAASGQTMLVRTNDDSALRRLPPDVARMLAKPSSGSGADSEQLIERAPVLPLAEIKSGGPLIVLSTQGAKPSEVTAILVLAGVEPILAGRPKGSGQVVIGPWSLGKGAGEDAP
jgi:hypothetical protein